MKVFISSVVRGFDKERDAASKAARTLGHDVKRCEDFGAVEISPQQACLAGVRWADVIVLLLGTRYGACQPSGLSATEEEYREARERGNVLAFMQNGIQPEPEQEKFIDEVRSWQGGVNTASFEDPADLEVKVTSALHGYEVRGLLGSVDADALRARVLNDLPRISQTPGAIHVLVGMAPEIVVLRPVDFADQTLQNQIRQAALLGPNSILDPEQGSKFMQAGNELALEQSLGARLAVSERGDLVLSTDVSHHERFGTVSDIIQEELAETLSRCYRLAHEVLDLLDDVGRLTHALPIAVLDRGYLALRTRADHSASPNSVSIPMAPARLVADWPRTPVVRAALVREADVLADNVVAQFRTQLEDR
jgi:hypothetical protein